ncbi:MAG TPA: glycosyltransferase family 2 protein [Longimicrobiales bacterium]|jgi:glycosyltransferase involved in cell wall biosynthesis
MDGLDAVRAEGGIPGEDGGSGGHPDAVAAAATLGDRARWDFAVLVPALDEAEVIMDTVRELRAAFDRYDLHGAVVVVDDGSSDGTARRAREAGEGWEALTVVEHGANRGKTEALLTAAAHTDRDVLVVFDADLQHLPDEIPRFLARIQEGWDVVTGRKVGAYDKRAVSSVYNALSRRIFNVPVSDLNSMKAFRRDALEGLHLRHDWHRFFVVLAHARGSSVTEIDVELLPRRAGVSKYQGPFRVVLGFLDLLSVWFLLWFSRKPLLLFGSAGGVMVGLGLVVGAVAFWLRFVMGLGFRPLLYLVIVLETVGFLLLGFGLVAEMIAQLREETEALRRDLARLGGGGAT